MRYAQPIKKTLRIAIPCALLAAVVGGALVYARARKLLPFYGQLTRDRLGTAASTQPPEQNGASYVGSWNCRDCHETEYEAWRSSNHSRMIQSVNEHPEAIVADFSRLPGDADFSPAEIVYTVGSKFKQRYMLRANSADVEDYVLGSRHAAPPGRSSSKRSTRI